jgi:hypothetical protein
MMFGWFKKRSKPAAADELPECRRAIEAPFLHPSEPMNTTLTPTAATPEILLISDFPVDEDQLACVRRLFGECTSDDDIAFSPERRTCRWPLRLAHPAGVVDSPSFCLYLCASFLILRREVVDRIHMLGCNLELCLDVPPLVVPFEITAATMKHLSDLHIQLSLTPTMEAETGSRADFPIPLPNNGS